MLIIPIRPGWAQDNRPSLSLDGPWEFRFAPDGRGVEEKWFQAGTPFPQTLRVPGSWDAQGVGARTDKMNHNALGVGWYRRTFALPPAWKGRRVWLVVGGAHRRAAVWVNGRSVAEHTGYPVSFRADITPCLVPGSRQIVVIAVDSRRDTARDPLMGSFDTVDYMDVNWGGLHESVHLEATEDARIEDVFIQPDPAQRSAFITAEWLSERENDTALTLDCVVRRWRNGPTGAPLASRWLTLDRGSASPVSMALSLPGAPLWTPDQPNLLILEIILRRNGKVLDRRAVRFGLRRLEIRGKEFLLNGEKFFLRGYGDDWNFPVEIIGPGSTPLNPPASGGKMDTPSPLAGRVGLGSSSERVEAWKRYLRVRKAFGFNGVRHHSCMPPESYLAAADEVGMFVQPELPIAYMPFFEEAVRAGSLGIYRQVWEEYIRQMRNHPSVFAWCMGNELPDTFRIAPELYKTAKQLDPTRPVIDTDGLFSLPDRPTLDYLSYQFPEGTLPWGAARNKYRMPVPVEKPVLVHEMSNLSVLPDPGEIPRYTGGIRPFWLEEMAARVKAQGLEARLPEMLAASRRLQTGLLKLNIEAARLCPDVRGYHQWLFRDYWAQSTGFVSQFDGRRAITPESARRFNGPAALLWDRDRANYRAGETVPLRLYLSDFRPASAPPPGPVRVQLGGETVTLKPPDGAGGRGLLGPWTGEIRAPEAREPKQGTLRAEAKDLSNEWPVWVFPPSPARAAGNQGEGPGVRVNSDGALVVRWPTLQTLARLEEGASVLLTEPESLFPTLTASFKPAWWHGDDADHVYGNMLLRHPALRGFPADGYGDLQMYSLMDGRPVVLLDDVPGRIEPIAWCLDVPWKMRRKAYLFEARVGKGRLLVSSFNLSRRARESDPAAAWLYGQLVRYVNGPDFRPAAELPSDWLQARIASSETADLAGAVEGFARIVETTEGRKTWHSYRENDVDLYGIRQTDGRQRLVWQTAPAPKAFGAKTVTFAWAGGIGWETEPDGGRFTLAINGAPALDFPFTTQSALWRSADGAITLRYVVRRRLGPDSFGIFLLTVPADRVRPGQPLELTVMATAQNSKRWFGVTPYTDVVAEER
jgi:beta-galactosidase